MPNDTSETPFDPSAGGTGGSMEEAIVIAAPDEWTGVDREYACLSARYGQRGTGWDLQRQSLLMHEGKKYDRMDITLADGTERTVYFDITAFFGH